MSMLTLTRTLTLTPVLHGMIPSTIILNSQPKPDFLSRL